MKYILANNEVVIYDETWTPELLDAHLGKGKWKEIQPPPDSMQYPEWDGKKWVNNDPRTYIEKRAEAYPPIAEQLDMIFHAIDTGTALNESEFYKKIKQVKAEYPKVGNDG